VPPMATTINHERILRTALHIGIGTAALGLAVRLVSWAALSLPPVPTSTRLVLLGTPTPWLLLMGIVLLALTAKLARPLWQAWSLTLVVVLTGQASHLASLDLPSRIAASPVWAVHVLASDLWVGFLLVLVALSIAGSGHVPTAQAVRLGRPLLVCIVAIPLTGVALGWLYSGGLPAGPWGALLLLKGAVLLVCAPLGLEHHLRMRNNAQIPTRSVSLEAVLAVAVVCLAALAATTAH
jgi:hypothetical protein